MPLMISTTAKGRQRLVSAQIFTQMHCLYFSCHPTFSDKKVLQPCGQEKIKSFARNSLTKSLVDQIDKNVAMAISK